MSYKFEHKGRKFWAKEVKGHTKVYYLEHKGLAEKLADLPKQFDSPAELIADMRTRVDRALEILDQAGIK
jgi:hypothetical protein